MNEADLATVCMFRGNLLARMRRHASAATLSALLRAFEVRVPNEGHLLAAAHAQRGTVVLTLNIDNGIEQAHALLVGAAQLPAGTPPVLHERLQQWRRQVNPLEPLNVVTPAAAMDGPPDGPVLVRLRGSAEHGWHPNLVPVAASSDRDAEVLADDQMAVLELASASGHLVIAGVSGADQDCRTALLQVLRPDSFTWTSAALSPELVACLQQISPDQPVLRPAVEGVRSALHGAAQLPAWPPVVAGLDGFAHRLQRWHSNVDDHWAAWTYADLLDEVGLSHRATVLRDVLAERFSPPSGRLHRGLPGRCTTPPHQV